MAPKKLEALKASTAKAEANYKSARKQVTVHVRYYHAAKSPLLTLPSTYDQLLSETHR